MGYALLWLETLGASLLLVATLLACIGRLRWRWLRRTLGVAVALVPLVALTGLTVLAGLMQFAWRINDRWFYPLLCLTILYALGAAALFLRGLRRESEGVAVAAATWPQGRLAMALGVFIGLQMTTLWGIDMQVQQRLAGLRSEARALALSVAPAPIPDAENAALIYAEAFEAMKFTEDWEQAWHEKWWYWNALDESADVSWNDPSSPKCNYQDPDLESFLRHQAGVLAALREAAARPDCYFDRAYYIRPSLCLRLRGLQEMHDGAKLLALSARWNVAHGQIDAAMTDIKALCGMAEHVSNEPNWFCLNCAAGIDHWAIDALSAALARGQVAPDDLAGLRMGEGISYQQLLQRALRIDEARFLDIVYEVGVQQEFDWLGAFAYPRPGCGVRACLGRINQLFLLEDDLANIRQYYDWLRWLAVEPYYHAKQLNRYEEFEDSVRSHAGCLTRAFGPGGIALVAQNAATADARRRVARVAVTAARYQAEQRGLPEGLEELTPDFIAAVPIDPFDGKPLKFKRTKRGLTIYSIGPDMIDDNGTPFDEETKKGDIIFELPDREQNVAAAVY